jgi:hypothetical protein
MTIEQLYKVTGDHAAEFNMYLLDNYNIEVEYREELKQYQFSVEDGTGWIVYDVPEKLIKHIWLEWYSGNSWNIDDEIERYIGL